MQWPQITGQVGDWDIVVVGHLKWNRYFGDSSDNPPRGDPSTCTSVCVRGRDTDGQPFVLLVDPTLRATASDYYFDLNRRTGLHAQDVTHCFVTHHHMDHHAGLAYFPDAMWLSAPTVIEALAASGETIAERMSPVTGEFLPGVCALPLPGHTLTLHGLAIAWRDERVVVAADAVMTKGHYAHETTEFEADARLARETIRGLKDMASLIVPGHDDLIVNR